MSFWCIDFLLKYALAFLFTFQLRFLWFLGCCSGWVSAPPWDTIWSRKPHPRKTSFSTKSEIPNVIKNDIDSGVEIGDPLVYRFSTQICTCFSTHFSTAFFVVFGVLLWLGFCSPLGHHLVEKTSPQKNQFFHQKRDPKCH